MSLRKPKTFSSAKEVFKSYFPKTSNDKSSASDERYGRTDYDFPKRLANNFRSALEGKRGR
jgi:transposase-like protein